MRRLILFLAVLVCGVAVGTPAIAQQAAKAPTVEDCLMCHGDASAARADGRPVMVLSETYQGSIHGQAGVSCVDCHTDLQTAAEWPHAERLQPAQCTTCHESSVQQYESGVHAEARRVRKNMVAATCVDCHGSHDIKPSADPESRTNHMKLIDTCGRCHGDVEVIKRGNIRIGNVVDMFRDSIHGQALLKSGLSVAPSCTDCHNAHDIRLKSDEKSKVFRTTVPATCGSCHEGIAREYWTGIHGTQVQKGSPLAPVCSDCHTAHQIRRSEVEGWQLEVINECGTCHEQSLATYRDTYHGQVTNLGFSRVASCASCHGAHAIFPKSDERSMVAPANVVKTCAQCHEGATPRFAQYDPHADPHNVERNPLLSYTARFMQMLLFGVFSFFGLHAVLWFGREVQVKTSQRRREPAAKAVAAPAPDDEAGEDQDRGGRS